MSSYVEFGIAIKAFRLAADQSVADVSAAIELEKALITEIEAGTKRPDEEVLELFINHFALRDSEAERLWELAGYGDEMTEELKRTAAEIAEAVAAASTNDDGVEIDGATEVTGLRLDRDAKQAQPVLYTDVVHIMSSAHGIVLQFGQSNGKPNQAEVISKVGMSREHARSIVRLLEKTIAAQDEQEDREQKGIQNSKPTSEEKQ